MVHSILGAYFTNNGLVDGKSRRVHPSFLLLASMASKCTANAQAIQLAMPDRQKTIDSSNQDIDSKTRVVFIASLITPNTANAIPSNQKTNPPSQCAPPAATISSRFIEHFLNLRDITSFEVNKNRCYMCLLKS